ncbi:MAG TPA: alpha amylase C-terminal domain-containing protein, partial [Saprospiraceae bacterium]|nr:alpha amylase C-terminal domain-containing protein [Saprospiraceae bacterium]
VKELNRLYTTYNALYYHNFHPAGFEWLSVNDRENSVLIFLRKGKTEVDKLIIVLNLTPVIREHYRFGVPDKGSWRELLNSDDKKWGGSGVHNKSAIRATKKAEHNRDYSISITCPPLSIVVFEPVRVVKKTVKKGKP